MGYTGMIYPIFFSLFISAAHRLYKLLHIDKEAL